MNHPWKKNHRYHHIPVSIFLKLTGILVVTGAILTILVIGFFRSFYTDTKTSPFRAHIHQYAAYILNDIGNPPDTLKAKALSHSLDAGITIRTGSDEWKSDSDNPSAELTTTPDWEKKDEAVRFGETKDRFFVEISGSGYQVILFPANQALFQPDWRKISVLLILILLILFISYLLIRRILKPLRLLMDGIRQISDGDLKVRFPEKRDEFGLIGRLLTDMTQTIGAMIRSRDQLLIDVSHELRSPVTRIRLAMEMLGNHPQKEGMIRDIQEMDHLITHILESERIKNSTSRLIIESFDLNILLQDITAIQGFPRQLTFHPPSEPVIINGDRERVRILFRNLLDNAGKYGSSQVDVYLSTIDAQACVEVIDDGVGISPEDIPHLFEPFYRADKSRTRTTGGFGLGLSMCKTIADANGGRIEVQSEPGKTVFRVYLPVNQ